MIKIVNDNVRLQALIDGKKVVITEASIRHDLKLNDAAGTSCLPNAMIFEELARMSSSMASAIICLANSQKFNFSKYILDNLKKNLEAGVPFYMLPRKHKPMRKEKKERKETKLSPIEDPVPTPFSDPLPSGEDSMPLKELMVLCTNLSNKVFDLENEVIEMKSSHKAKITELESRVEKLEEKNRSLTKELKSFNSKVDSLAVKETIMDKEKSSKQGRKITDIDANAEVNLENVYNLDLDHEEIVLSMHDATDVDGKEVAEEIVEVITTAKIIIDEVSTAGGELNAADEEPVSVAPTNITTAQPSEATKTTVDISIAPKAKGIVFHDVEKPTTRTAFSKANVKDKGKAKLVKEPKVLKSRKPQIAIDKEVARRIEAEWNADMQDNIDWNEVVEQENAEKQKLIEQQEAKELKRNLEIVPDDEDDVFVNVVPLSSKPPTIVDYKIYKEEKKEHFQIIRANENYHIYLAFSTMLKNFEREDLEVLWKIVKDSQAKPKGRAEKDSVSKTGVARSFPGSNGQIKNDQIAPILGYGDLVQGAVTIKRVYYVEGLNHNLFSVSQFCDADLEVAFRKSTCFIRDLKGNNLLTGSRGRDLYSITLLDTNCPNPICLMAKASSSQAWLWRRRLSHLNFDTINLLS
nr:integrase, catalytic region, zinc finger, CCHC-type, peptidase aspartic, catalytic [Tanacetum cinerariifolium]